MRKDEEEAIEMRIMRNREHVNDCLLPRSFLCSFDSGKIKARKRSVSLV